MCKFVSVYCNMTPQLFKYPFIKHYSFTLLFSCHIKAMDYRYFLISLLFTQSLGIVQQCKDNPYIWYCKSVVKYEGCISDFPYYLKYCCASCLKVDRNGVILKIIESKNASFWKPISSTKKPTSQTKMFAKQNATPESLDILKDITEIDFGIIYPEDTFGFSTTEYPVLSTKKPTSQTENATAEPIEIVQNITDSGFGIIDPDDTLNITIEVPDDKPTTESSNNYLLLCLILFYVVAILSNGVAFGIFVLYNFFSFNDEAKIQVCRKTNLKCQPL